MDFNNLTAKVKGFQRRTTQKVLQQMGMADKTEDDSPAFQNFLALGSFASQLKTTIQSTNSNLEKAIGAQTHLASQVQAYLSSELSGDGDMPPGELSDFFSGNDAHSAILESISAKFCDASTELGHSALIQVIGQLDDLILRPLQKDEEFGVTTKELVEEKKKATLDFDSYRRMAQNATSPSEHEKAEAKARASRDRYDDINRRVADHINVRNQIRCKLLVHGILTAIQQYCSFYTHAVDILRDTADSLKPLLDVYQMNESQLQSTVNLNQQSRGPQDRAKSPPQGKVSADSLFNDYESQNRGPGAKQAPPPRSMSPQLDSMMRDNLNIKKPAATQQAPGPQRNEPMNQQINNVNSASSNVGARTPPPTHQPNVNSPAPSQPSPTQPVQQSFVDLLGGDSISPSQAGKPQTPKEDILVNLMEDHHTAPAKGNNLFDGDLLGSGTFAPPAHAAPPMHPSNVDIFGPFSTSSTVNAKKLENEFDFLTNKPPVKPNNNNNSNINNARPQNAQSQQRPNPQQQQQNNFFDFGDFGGSPNSGARSGAGPTPPQPAAGFATPPPKPKEVERHELNPAVTQKISNWAERGGRKANLRALLSTLHEVIWVDSGWDAMSLGELITQVQVKKAYHRANLIVHPDKVQNGTVEQQLMAQRIFEALRVSYETFKDEPK